MYFQLIVKDQQLLLLDRIHELNQSEDYLLVERNLGDSIESRKSFIAILRVAAYSTYT